MAGQLKEVKVVPESGLQHLALLLLLATQIFWGAGGADARSPAANSWQRLESSRSEPAALASSNGRRGGPYFRSSSVASSLLTGDSEPRSEMSAIARAVSSSERSRVRGAGAGQSRSLAAILTIPPQNAKSTFACPHRSSKMSSPDDC